jgi:hypothetical protein
MTRQDLELTLSIKTRIERKKQCWFIRGQDWSNYTTIKGKVGHRVVYQLCKGQIAYGMFICHTCDRKGCINPDHLFQGTQSDNMKDARKKGRVNNIHILSRELKRLREIDNWKNIRVFTGRR